MISNSVKKAKKAIKTAVHDKTSFKNGEETKKRPTRKLITKTKKETPGRIKRREGETNC